MGAEAALISGGAESVKSLAGTPFKAAGGVMNLIEAGKQADAQRSAERAAEQAVAEAKRLQETNFLGAVQVPMEAYNQALNQSTANQMQALSALQEAGPRELAGGVGRVNAVANEQVNDINNQVANSLYNLSVAQANEQGQTNDALSRLNLGQAEGAQKAAMAAQLAKIQLQQGALNNFGSAYTGAVDALTPVYKQGQQGDSTTQKNSQAAVTSTQTQQVPQVSDMQGFLQQQTMSPQPLTQGAMNKTTNEQEMQNIMKMLMSNPELLNSIR
jgi:hypothetical protein